MPPPPRTPPARLRSAAGTAGGGTPAGAARRPGPRAGWPRPRGTSARPRANAAAAPPGVERAPRSAVVDELEGDVEVGVLEQGDDGLQVVAALARHPQLVAGDLRFDGLGALLADDLRDLLRVLLRQALLEGGLDPVLLAGGPRFARVDRLERHAALDQLGL